MFSEVGHCKCREQLNLFSTAHTILVNSKSFTFCDITPCGPFNVTQKMEFFIATDVRTSNPISKFT
jgi:hypothetical protein